MALNNIECTPAHVGGDEITIVGFAFVFQSDDTSFGFVATDVEPGTTDVSHDLVTASDAHGVWGTGMSGKIIRHTLFTLMQADFLIATNLREHLNPAKTGRGAVDKSACSIEGIGTDTGDVEALVLGLKLM